ncbi:hypothetical protein [Flavihumibacter solisilvae]|uniref:DUF748 domain-containing protein n=1 Tax=Flavihumibacter solisilvae TaxID=1349421 RepID=A0A0C1L0G2_9BACT|nr:hypothetical protein [Flavihumibacter solisilvae]KIC93477.1 hypothetical protein OI18_17100 [Flavihumibacter solisilvae]
MKRLVIIILVLAAVGTAVYFVARKYVESPDLARQLKERLVQLVAEKSNGLYQLSIGEINIDADNTSAVLKDIRLQTDSVLLGQLIENRVSPAVVYDFSLDNLIIKNVDILSFLNENSARLKTITVSGGKLVIRRLGRGKDSVAVASEPRHEVLKSVRRSLREVRIDTVHINDIDFRYVNLKKQEQKLKKLHIDLYSIAIDSTALHDSTRIFFAKQIMVSMDSISLPVAKNMYRLSAEKLVLAAGEKRITTIHQLRFLPVSGKSLEALAAETGKQRDVFRLKVSDLTIHDFDYMALLEDSAIVAGSVILKKPVLQVFNDKSQQPPTESKVGKYPIQLLAKLPYGVRIPRVEIEQGSVTYQEKNEQGNDIGNISFDQVNGSVGPLRFSSAGTFAVKAEFRARFMSRSPMHVRFDFPVSRNGQFSVRARFDPFEVEQLNQAALPLGSMKLKEGKVTRLDFEIKGDNTSATGTTTMNYEGLKVEVMKSDDGEDYKKRGLLTLFANKFVLNKDNKPGDRHKDTYTASYKRVTTKSYFNLVWKTLFYGVKANTGVGLKGRDKERARIH